MSRMRCNNIKPEYNNLLFQIKQTPGDRLFCKSSRGIYTRTIPEGYYMNRNNVKKINPVINFFKRMIETMKGIMEDTFSNKSESAGDKEIYKGTTIEI